MEPGAKMVLNSSFSCARIKAADQGELKKMSQNTEFEIIKPCCQTSQNKD
jgi:hypothetical protein